MLKSLSIPNIFGVQKKQERSIQSIKAQVLVQRSYAVEQPFWTYAAYVLIAANVALMLSYLLGVNASASTGYEIKKIQQRIEAYTEENKKLNLKISEQSSIAGIQSDYTHSGYVPISSAKFLEVNYLSEANPVQVNQ